ncbi:MAG TPA: 2-C-methyl-D-erythritol 4-phosphate cytidylyltransferase, partial [Ktedonobacteraceae bacterium]|nr:2-C-methyl-D-erythritol 4-phosphate cytidylyltransferase [Ktedonobacteraceae bacterium]
MQERAAAIIVAAGSSRRMEGRDKLWTPLAGRFILARTVDVFMASPLISTVILVLSPERLEETHRYCLQENWQKIGQLVPGGPRRQDSVRAGLDTLAEIAPETRWVMIHDGARPLVTPQILEDGLKAAQEFQAAVAAVPVKDTIKQVQAGIITSTPERSQPWAVQTPQIFAFSLIHQAHQTELGQSDATDDAALLERMGHQVAIFPGSYTNLKITT